MKILPSFISDELCIIRAFNDKQEAQISDFIDNIEQHIKVAEVERWGPNLSGDGDIGIDQIEHLAGISEEEYDIRELFREVMPIYQRQAMLLTLWGVLDSEIKDMYLYVSGEKCLPEKSKKISDFKHVINCLSKIGIPPEPTKEYEFSVKTLDCEVRLIRNAWAHNSGKDPKNKIPKGIPGIGEKYSQIAISKEYINKVVSLMHALSQELNKSVRNYTIATNKQKNANHN
ncbi:hypothetical protein [Shewanella baltica]|uniref:hypothetical protein n=1 Tax=Shewanella baltica TaxID=62322 RepID=UPI0039AF7AAA